MKICSVEFVIRSTSLRSSAAACGRGAFMQIASAACAIASASKMVAWQGVAIEENSGNARRASQEQFGVFVLHFHHGKLTRDANEASDYCSR
jgi:hypothetical protein